MSQIGKYRLSERIGAGAMGEVDRAHDTVLDRPVALRVISGGDRGIACASGATPSRAARDGRCGEILSS